MAELVVFRVHGLDEIEGALREAVTDLAAELRPGFAPEHRYLGEGGVPFVLEKIRLVATRRGLTLREGL